MKPERTPVRKIRKITNGPGRALTGVIPAQAGIQKRLKKRCFRHTPGWIPAFAGMTVNACAGMTTLCCCLSAADKKFKV